MITFDQVWKRGFAMIKLVQGSAERGADFERNDLRFFNEPSDRLMTRNRVW